MPEIETTDVADAGDESLPDTDLTSDGPDGPGSSWPAPDAVDAVADPAVTSPVLTRRGRVRKWDRPPTPHDWRWYTGNLGKVLITLGVLMFGFVAYQLWGTGIETARAQHALENEFEDLLAATPPVEIAEPFDDVEQTETTTAPVTTLDTEGDDEAAIEPAPETTDPETEPTPDSTATDSTATATVVVPVEDQNIPFVENGDAIARIEIPRIGVNDIVVAGVTTSDLKKGPGHFPDTPLPGQLGNSAIAGHRTTYGQPFHDVDKLEPGDEIRMTTLNGVFVYRVTGTQIVSPSDYQVVATTDPTTANLTLTSCHPKWTARERIVIFSELDRTASAAVGEPVLNYGQDDIETIDGLPAEDLPADDPPAEDPPDDGLPADDTATDTTTDTVVDGSDDMAAETGDDEVTVSPATDDRNDPEPTPATTGSDGFADAFSDGWFSDPAANPQVGMWGMLLAFIGIAAYLISRKFRRDWVGALVGIVPFVVALYFFFQNVNRLLPPNL